MYRSPPPGRCRRAASVRAREGDGAGPKVVARVGHICCPNQDAPIKSSSVRLRCAMAVDAARADGIVAAVVVGHALLVFHRTAARWRRADETAVDVAAESTAALVAGLARFAVGLARI